MNRQGRYQMLGRLARGTVFALSNHPSDTKSWRVIKHTDGMTTADRLHEDKTLKRQSVSSSAMVFVPEPEPEPETEVNDMDDLKAERKASAKRRARKGTPDSTPHGNKDWGGPDIRAIPLGDGGYLTGKAPTEGGNDG